MGRIKKEHKEKILEKINPDTHEISWNDEGVPYKFKKKSEIKKGKDSRAKGSRFELKVRKDLESKGKIVDKWTNNIDLEKNEIAPAKRKYNPFKKVMVIGTGFPDFIAIEHLHGRVYSVIGVEAKMNGILSKIEKEKCKWYLEKNIFSEIWIAKQGEKRGEIKYVDFAEKYNKSQ